MKFARNLAETLKANDRDEIAKRYMLLSDPKLEGILTTDEVTKWQQDRADLSKTQATLLPHRARAPSLPQYTQMR
jgi:Zn-dependent M16 (insulinase) family peptidase